MSSTSRRAAGAFAAIALAASIALGSLAPAVATAAEVTGSTPESCKEYNSLTDWGGVTQSVSLDRFTLANARLTSVRIRRTVDIYSDLTLASENDGPATISGTIDGQVHMDASNGLGDLTDPISETVNETQPGGTGSFSKRYDIPVVSDSANLTSSAELTRWSGGGQLTFTGTAIAKANYSSSGNARTSVRTTALMRVCVAFDYVETVTTCVGDYVWYDADKDGVQDANESPVVNSTVTIRDTLGHVLGTTSTDASGHWLVCGLEPNQPCTGSITIPTNYVATTRFVGTDAAVDSNVSPDATFSCTTPARGSDLTFDAGVAPVPTPVVPNGAAAPAPAQLATAKRSLNPSVGSGGITTFSVTVRNLGAATVASVTVCDTPPRQLAFRTRPAGSFFRNGRLCWTVRNLGAKQARTFRYTMRAASVRTATCVTNRVSATASIGGTSAASARQCIRARAVDLNAHLPLAG